MSQKEDDNDNSYNKNFYAPNSLLNQAIPAQQQPQLPLPPQQQSNLFTQSQQQEQKPLPSSIQPPSSFLPAPPMPPSQMPPYYWDYYHYYPSMANPPQFDPNLSYQKQTTTSLLTPNKPSTSNKNTLQQAPFSQPTAPPPYMPPMMPSPFMDPYMASYMAHMYGYPFSHGLPPMGPGPYGLGHHTGSAASMSGGQRQLQEDQISLHSYHYDMDTRSEKRHNLNSSIRQTNLPNFKQEPGLLIKDPNSIQSNQMIAPTNNETLNLDPTTSSITENSMIKRDETHRMTPQLHQLPHVRASFSLNGIVQIRANDPCEGQPALVDMINLSDLMEQYLTNMKSNKTISLDDENDDDDDETSNEIRNQILNNYKLMQEFPGPLIREYTSKAQVIQFCQKNVKQCLTNTNLIDPQSHALLWDFLSLLVRQNGLIDLKTDVSPLLLTGIGAEPLQQQQQQTLTVPTPKQLSNSPSSSSLVGLQQSQDFVLVNNDGAAMNNLESTIPPPLPPPPISTSTTQKQSSEEEIYLHKLRQLLGAGQKSDAIETAIKLNMWPHALFLASYSSSNNSSQTDSKLLNKVKLRFINSLPCNDPIQTCYQLLTGRVPSVANNISKLDWNDWRKHLAMIVSNIDEANKDLVLNSIKTMGDSLASNGRVAASHFCYLLANCAFGTYEKKSSKLVLIGSSHNQDFIKFCQINAIQATEIFEFANSLSSSSNGMLDHFVKYKLIYTTRLLEFGLINEASKYIEVIGKSINSNPKLHSSKISTVFQMANRLKIFHSDFVIDDLNTNSNSNEPQWLQELSNNYKKLYLNKLWHLLPIESESTPKIQIQEQQMQYQPQDEQYQQQNEINLNVLTTKNEPKTVEPSPVNQSNIIQNNSYYESQYQQPQQVQQQQYQYDIPELGQDMNRLNLQIDNSNSDIQQPQQQQPQQQSVPFYPTYSSNDNTQINYSDQSSSQLFDPSNQQQQQQQQSTVAPQFYNPHDYNQSNQSPSYLESKQQTFNFNSNTIYNNQPPPPPPPQTSQTVRRSSNASGAAYTSNRSRQSSTSTSYEPSYNLYSTQQQQHHHQPLFDPSSSHMPRSATYPVNNQPESSQLSSHLSSNPIKEEPSNLSSSKNNKDETTDDDEDFNNKDRKDNKIQSQNAQGSEWWLKRMINSIRPANTAKRMVLPDDKKKTIVWDEKAGRYINKEASEEQAAALKPPPIFLPNAPTAASSQDSTQPSTSGLVDQPGSLPSLPGMSVPPTGNRFSLKNAAGNKRSYYSKIDVMADQTKKITPNMDQQQLNPLLSTMPPPSQLPPRFFVPEPVSSTSATTQQPSEQHQDQNLNQQQQQQQDTQQYEAYHQNNQQMYQPNFVPQPTNYQNTEQQNNDYYYQQQQQQQQQPQLLMPPSNYQENYTTEESSDSNTNSHESYNGSSQTSSSNDSNYIQQQQQYYQQQQQQQYGNYQYYPTNDNNNQQFYDPNQHSNI